MWPEQLLLPKGSMQRCYNSEDCIEHERKNTEVEDFFHNREERMLGSCYCWYLRTDYSQISINSPLNYVI